MPALSSPESARRVFDRDDELIVYVEVVKNGSTQSQSLSYAVTLEGEAGARAVIGAEPRPAGNDRREVFTTRAALRDVEPGRYLLRVEARSERGGDPMVRQIPIEVL